MNGELCLRLFAKFIIHISLLLWQLSHEFKFQTTAQNTTDPLLPEEEVSALNAVAENLRSDQTFTVTFCKNEDNSHYEKIGVFCNCSFNHNKSCHITKIVWYWRGLNGFLPEAVAKLTHLEELNLSGNKIQGEIPATLGNMSWLNYLNLYNNVIEGEIPATMGNLSRLRYLYLHNNVIEGEIPATLGNLSRLRYLDLSYNQLSGTIPNSLGSLKVEYLYFENNMLTGTIPPSLGDISGLVTLFLHSNQLNGSLPPELGKLTSLQDLRLQKNQFSGSLPPELGKMTSLQYLYLYENQLNGPLPPELGKLTSLEYLYLQSNNISGKMPDSFAQLPILRSFSISGNYLSGPFPEFIKTWTSIKYLSSYGNNFEGKIPPEIFNLRSLETLEISDAGTSTFRFPSSANLTSIKTLVLRNCSITGPIPRYIANMSSLEYLDLSFNNLTDLIPNQLNILNITYMSFANNRLSGPIPAWISRAAKWTEIDLSYNDFNDASNLFDQRSDHRISIPNLNLFSCCRYCTSSNCRPELKGVHQLKRKYCDVAKNHSLHINCGGELKNISGNLYDQDNITLPYQVRASPNGTNFWAFSMSGSFLSEYSNSSDYIKKVKCGIAATDAPLYTKARLAPVSLKYYGLCLLDGNYSVTLYFSEIVYKGDDAEQSGLEKRKRIFDVYIQNQMVRRNFDINKTASLDPENVARIENHTAKVENGLLAIHLYWAGKGSSGNPPDFNGPLISGISVTLDNKLGVVGDHKKLSGSLIAMIALGSITFALLLSLAFAWMMGWLEQKSPEIKVGEGKTITLKQLIVATRGFSKDVEIGRGGFGTVYRAELPDQYGIVAVKKLSTLSNEGLEKLNVGIYHLQNLRHENLVRLFDIYVGKGLCFLVYEYMENKSLADALFEHKINLRWDARVNICVGIAKGLRYLHEHPRLKMVHWGIKAANILLDGKFRPKISDLGLASASVENDNEASHFLWMMKTEASTGYMAPEYPTIGKKSGYKYDVYSFGVVMLEIVCGRKNVGAGLKNKHELELLVDEVCIADSRGKLPSLVDESLSGTYDMKQAMTILKLAMKCTHISPGVRPTMSQVVSVLAEDRPLDEISAPASKDDQKTIEGSSEDLAIDADRSLLLLPRK